MKNLSLILNIVLLIAVGVLFFLHFSKDKPAGGSSSTSVEPGELSVAYIDSDTVLKYYEYLKVNKATLEEKSQKMEQDFRNRAQGLQNEIAAYQRNVSSMTLGQVRSTEEELGKKQQNLQMYQQSLSQALMQEEQKLNQELYTRVTQFLKKYGKDKGLHVVLKHDPASDVLWASDALDISQDVISGLNSEYTAEKSGTAPKKDSAATK